MDRLKVLIIGAGPAGLCAARHISKNIHFHCDVFEQTSSIGGMWAYTDEEGEDKHGLPIHTSLYYNMSTNIPKEIMQYLDFPFPVEGNSYVHHSEILKYLNDYSDHYGLQKYIKFNKEVIDVTPVPVENQPKWKVLTKNPQTKCLEEHFYGAIMVCNGVPKIPHIPGIESFKGSVMHSHDYRRPEGYEGKTVIIWGASVSAFDIAKELSPVVKNVIISFKQGKKIPRGFPQNVAFSPGIASAFESGFKLESGYLYSFPFLSKECKIEVDDNYVTPLYKHMVNIEYPTMCLVGIPLFTIPFILYDYQVQYFLRTLDGSIKLPSREEMMKESHEDYMIRVNRNIPKRYSHLMNFMVWEYFDELAELADVEKVSPVVKEILDDSNSTCNNEISDFKKFKYEVLDSENFKKYML